MRIMDRRITRYTSLIIRWSAALMLLILLLPKSEARAAAGTGGSISVEEYGMERDGKKIYGKLYMPQNAVCPLPLVILSHGLGSDHRIMEPYAERFAESGFAAYVFDFIGGSESSLSDGSMLEMSVLTEAEDLNCILDAFLADSRFSKDGIFLFGGSQGGFVSAYAAGKRPDDAAGLILLYPAFNLQEICLTLIPDNGSIPDTAVIGEHTVGSVYIRDMTTFDIYEVLRRYTGPVLLFHGTADPLVPPENSRRAAEALSDAELVIVEGAGHGFKGKDLENTARDSAAFMREILSDSVQDLSAAA